MKIVIAGGSGLIGSRLAESAVAQGHSVVILSRRARAARGNIEYVATDYGAESLRVALDGADVVVNLAGRSVMGRWDAAAKREILSSRVEVTRALVAGIGFCARPPKVFLSASGIGYYGDTGEATADERSARGAGFLAEVCEEWEREAMALGGGATKVVRVRIGVVLDAAGGALPQMMLPFRFFAGGWVGSGRQWVSWIHVADLVQLFLWLAQNAEWAPAVVNAAAPNPVTMRQLTDAIGRAMHSPNWTFVPSFVIRAALGEGAAVVLDSTRAIPAALASTSFAFRYADIQQALHNLIEERR